MVFHVATHSYRVWWPMVVGTRHDYYSDDQYIGIEPIGLEEDKSFMKACFL
jgi:hypothetical protein